MFKKVSWSLFILILILIAIYRSDMSYGIQQVAGQLAITSNTEPIADVLNDTAVADSIKLKIELVQEARDFAFKRLGLKESDNYTTYYDQKGEVSLWNLSASEPYQLEPKLWKFPFLGSFPYKGFFNLERAKEEAEKLKADNWDVRLRPVNGWSTLGWTSDPILSNMLGRNEGSLVELIIHELTHATLFVKDDIIFNENLASFIGENGAIQFLIEKYGKNSEAYYEYLLSEEDSETFRNQMLLSAQVLDSLYLSLQGKDDSIKAIQKHIMIDQIIGSIDTLHFHDARYMHIFDQGRPNNAYFMSFLRYYSSKDSLETILIQSYDHDLKSFIKGMKDYHE